MIEYIYRLRDPRDNAIRYVGITKDIQYCLYGHFSGSSANQAKDLWMQET